MRRDAANSRRGPAARQRFGAVRTGTYDVQLGGSRTVQSDGPRADSTRMAGLPPLAPGESYRAGRKSQDGKGTAYSRRCAAAGANGRVHVGGAIIKRREQVLREQLRAQADRLVGRDGRFTDTVRCLDRAERARPRRRASTERALRSRLAEAMECGRPIVVSRGACGRDRAGRGGVIAQRAESPMPARACGDPRQRASIGPGTRGG